MADIACAIGKLPFVRVITEMARGTFTLQTKKSTRQRIGLALHPPHNIVSDQLARMTITTGGLFMGPAQHETGVVVIEPG